MSPSIKYDEAKLRELLLYVASQMLGDRSYGTVKLNKVLFFSDFYHYKTYGEPITGVPYVARRFGPAPKGITKVQEKLFDSREATMATSQTGPKMQKMLVALRPPDLSMFNGLEISTVDAIISLLGNATAMEASDLSHLLLAWKIADEGQDIPYHWVFLYDGPVTKDDETFASNLAASLPPELLSTGAS